MSVGYHVRMDLLIRWANLRFSTVNFIVKGNVPSNEVLESHLTYCNNLFILPSKSRSNRILKLLHILVSGRYPKFDSSLLLDKSLGINFGKVLNQYKTDYFLNTRHNFAGLIKYIPAGTVNLIDTQDIFTDIHIKYGLRGRSKWIQKLLVGYKEKGDFVRSEIEILANYDKIIAITDTDFKKYDAILPLRNKLIKVDSVGFEPKKKAVAAMQSKAYDCLMIASNFVGTQQGMHWFFNQVAPFLETRISLCIVGSISDYIFIQNYNNINVDVILKGVVADIEEYYVKSRIVLIVMEEATGTSVKGLEALSFGAAIISTSFGVRFGGLKNDKHCIIEDRPEAFALAIESLLHDKKRRVELGEKALDFANEKKMVDSPFDTLDSCMLEKS